MNEKTLGEKRVRTTFNPSESGTVDLIKQKSAELINLVNDIQATYEDAATNNEIGRLKSLAITNYEMAAMWAVKAATA